MDFNPSQEVMPISQPSANPHLHLSRTFFAVLSLGIFAMLVVTLAGFYIFVNYSYNSTSINQQPLYKTTSATDLTAQPLGASILNESSAPVSYKQDFSQTLSQGEVGQITFNITDPDGGVNGNTEVTQTNIEPSPTSKSEPSVVKVSEPSVTHAIEPTVSTDAHPTFSGTEPTTPSTEGTTSSSEVSLSSLKVTIAKVEVHLSQTENKPGQSTPADKWETLNTPANTVVDLIALKNAGGSLSDLGITSLAVGHYTQIRLYITNAMATDATGTTESVLIPGDSGVLKIAKQFDILPGASNSLTVDISASKSIIKKDNILYMLPVLNRVALNGSSI